MTDKKQAATKNRPVHTIRSGEVTASIFQRQSNAGFVYWDYSLGRTWRSAGSGKESHGTTFFGKHQTDLTRVIEEATDWLNAASKEEAPNNQGTDIQQKD